MGKIEIHTNAVDLLKQLIVTPSFSKEEDNTAAVLASFLQKNEIPFERIGNNIFSKNRHFDISKPSILLNSHHDTVKPNVGYTMDPFSPLVENGKLFGLGSNDAGGCLVSLLATFIHFHQCENLKFNLVFAASAEEEISGANGIEMLLPHLGEIAFGIVGEPTLMEMAVAERGLMVVDCVANGIAGHAARNEGESALYKAMDDIAWIRNYRFQKSSELLGETRLTVTVIETDNKQHNVVPAQCRFVIDARVNELYAFDEILAILSSNLKSDFKPRSTRMRSTSIALDHPIVKAGLGLGKGYYGSPTTSDMALMPFPALKMGPGDSARSHMANEFIYLKEIGEGIETYIRLLEQVI